ncbi:MAG TPA: response regulator transcription factor [Bacteroidetes bacterium]|nr:response regulator transcription factor [Bacteroidota bacterium]
MLNTIAIDDEPKALEIIQMHAGKIPFLEIKNTFRDAMSAIGYLQKNSADLALLDINMPNLSGLKFREIIGSEIMIIFTTAYSEYAVESYEQNAVDYLLKPIRFPRFLNAVLKAKKLKELRLGTQAAHLPKAKQNTENCLFIKSGNKRYKLNTSEILYIEKDGNYVFFHTADKKVMSRMNMQQVLDMLPDGQFVRVHKSWAVALKHIDILEARQVTVNSRVIPIGKFYEKEIIDKMK